MKVFSPGVNLILKYQRTCNSRFKIKLKVFILPLIKAIQISKKSLIYNFWVEVL